MASSTQASSKTTTVREAAQAASHKIRVQAQQAGQRSGHGQKGKTDKECSLPTLSKVLQMEQFSVLEIMDSEEIGVEEEIRVNDECVFFMWSIVEFQSHLPPC